MLANSSDAIKGGAVCSQLTCVCAVRLQRKADRNSVLDIAISFQHMILRCCRVVNWLVYSLDKQTFVLRESRTHQLRIRVVSQLHSKARNDTQVGCVHTRYE